jgi:MOSC domain-containing protein YiiM
VKAILEFTLPDDDWDFRVARCGVRFLQAWSEVKRQVHQKRKHGTMPKAVYEYVDELYTEMCRLEAETELEVGE